MLWLTEWLIRCLQWLSPRKAKARHLALGSRGEAAACLYLSRLGYRIVAMNFRSPHHRGEIDLIGWDGNVLCFIEVKTRTDDSFAPPSTAVTADKQANIRDVARAYLRRLTGSSRPTCRFDVVSVVPSPAAGAPKISLHRGAFSWSSAPKRAHEVRNRFVRRFRRDTRNLPRFR